MSPCIWFMPVEFLREPRSHSFIQFALFIHDFFFDLSQWTGLFFCHRIWNIRMQKIDSMRWPFFNWIFKLFENLHETKNGNWISYESASSRYSYQPSQRIEAHTVRHAVNVLRLGLVRPTIVNALQTLCRVVCQLCPHQENRERKIMCEKHN